MTDATEATTEATDAVETTDVGDAGFGELQQQFDDKGVSYDKSESAPTDDTGDKAGEADNEQDDAGVKEQGAVDDAPSETDDKTVELTKMQVEAAKQLDMSDDEVSELGANAGVVLDKAGMKIRQKISELGLIQQKLNNQAKDAGKKADTPAGDGSDTEAEIIFSDDGLLDDIDGAAKLNQMVESITSLRGDIAALQKAAANAEDREIVATCDRFFDGLDQEDYPQFGKGLLRSLTEDSDEYKARRELAKKAEILEIGYQSISGYAPPMEQLLNEALTIVAAEQMKAAARRETTDKITARSKQRIGRPGGRQAAKKSSNKETDAKQKLAQEFLDKGIKPGGSSSRKVSW